MTLMQLRRETVEDFIEKTPVNPESFYADRLAR